MTAITDLAYQNLQDEATARGLPATTFTVTGGKVFIDVSAVTGVTAADLTAKGVVDFMVKLRDICAGAQITINSNQATGERLSSFPQIAYGGLQSSGNVQISGTITATLKVAAQTLHSVGTNN